LLSDTTDVFGLKKRFFIVVAALLQIAASVILTSIQFQTSTASGQPQLFTFLVAMIVMARTLAGPVVESLMVV